MAENSRKRRRIDPVEICQQVYEVIRNYKKEDGSLLCDAFIRAPKRRQEPAYYDVVSNPIDMLRIQQKIRTDEYEELEQMTTGCNDEHWSESTTVTSAEIFHFYE